MIAGVVEKDFTSFTRPCRVLPLSSGINAMPQKIVHCGNVDSYNHAWDINNSGWIVGSQGDGSGPTYGYVWKAGVTTHIPNPVFGSELDAYGINETGVVVGSAMILGVTQRAILWDGASASSSWLPVLAGGSTSHATEINDQNFVSGTSQMLITRPILPGQVRNRAFLWHTLLGMYPLPVQPGVSPLTTACSDSSLNILVSSTRVIKGVGSCGKRAILWTIVVRKSP